MNHVQIEAVLTEMRRLLKCANELERRGMRNKAEAYGAMAANKLSIAVAQQYHVIPLTPRWGNAA